MKWQKEGNILIVYILSQACNHHKSIVCQSFQDRLGGPTIKYLKDRLHQWIKFSWSKLQFICLSFSKYLFIKSTPNMVAPLQLSLCLLLSEWACQAHKFNLCWDNKVLHCPDKYWLKAPLLKGNVCLWKDTDSLKCEKIDDNNMFKRGCTRMKQ